MISSESTSDAPEPGPVEEYEVTDSAGNTSTFMLSAADAKARGAKKVGAAKAKPTTTKARKAENK